MSDLAILLLVAAEFFLAVDLRQTICIAMHPDKYEETNVILGKHPSVLRVAVYFAFCMALVAVIALLFGIYGMLLCAAVAIGEAQEARHNRQNFGGVWWR